MYFLSICLVDKINSVICGIFCFHRLLHLRYLFYPLNIFVVTLQKTVPHLTVCSRVFLNVAFPLGWILSLFEYQVYTFPLISGALALQTIGTGTI